MIGPDSLAYPWGEVFELMREAYLAGCIPVGAVVTDAGGAVVATGRNRIFDEAHGGQLAGTAARACRDQRARRALVPGGLSRAHALHGSRTVPSLSCGHDRVPTRTPVLCGGGSLWRSGWQAAAKRGHAPASTCRGRPTRRGCGSPPGARARAAHALADSGRQRGRLLQQDRARAARARSEAAGAAGRDDTHLRVGSNRPSNRLLLGRHGARDEIAEVREEVGVDRVG